MAAVLPLPAPPATGLPPAELAKATQAARDFEAMAIGQLLEPMFTTVDLSTSPFGGGEAEQAWMPMLVQEIAKSVARAGGLGLARPVLAEMLRAQEARERTGGRR